MTGVLVVEDQQVLACALETAISAQPDLECAGTAGTTDEALRQIARDVPDVVLMDIELPGPDGIEGTRQIKARYPQISVLILTGGATPERLAAAAAAGADGFLAKNSTLADVLAAIRNPLPGKFVAEGGALRDLLRHGPARPAPASARAGKPRARRAGAGAPVLDEEETPSPEQPDLRPGPGPGDAGLTAREQEVLALMGQGLDPSAIADRLVVSVYTARGHVKNVMMKLGAHTQLEAVVLASKQGLLPDGPGDQDDQG